MTSGDNQYPVSVCLQYRETLSLEACRYQFPVETCVANPELLGESNDLIDLVIGCFLSFKSDHVNGCYGLFARSSSKTTTNIMRITTITLL